MCVRVVVGDRSAGGGSALRRRGLGSGQFLRDGLGVNGFLVAGFRIRPQLVRCARAAR